MATVKIDKFAGLSPRTHPTMLSDGMATVAKNCRLKNGKLVPIRKPSGVSNKVVRMENGLSRISDARSIFTWKHSGDIEFIAFPGIVNVCEGNIADDEYDRLFVSGDTGIGKNGTEPCVYMFSKDSNSIVRHRMAKDPLPPPRVRRSGGQDIVKDVQFSMRGIMSASGINGLTSMSKGDVYRCSDEGFLNKGPSSGGLIVDAGSLVYWTGSYWNYYNSETINAKAVRYTYFFHTWVDEYGYESGVSEKCQVYERTCRTAAKPAGDTSGEYGWSISIPAGADYVSFSKGLDSFSAKIDHCSITFGESGTIASVDVYNDNDVEYNDGDYITVDGLRQDEVPDGGGTAAVATRGYKRRIYKVITGYETESVQFVAEFSSSPWQQHTFSVKDEDAGEVLTETESIPRDIRNVAFVPGGFYVGFSPSNPKTVMFSEVDMPTNWPTAYRYDIKDNIVGIAVTSNNVFVLTDGFPWIISGTSPESMTVSHIAGPAACVSTRSVCVLRNSVYFASNIGISVIANSADAGVVCENLTDKVFTKDQWSDLNPSSCMMSNYDGALFCFFTKKDGSKAGYVIDLTESSNAVTTHDEESTCLCVDNKTDTLYFVRDVENGGE